MKGRTTFVIAHRLSTIRRADQILVMEQGRIVERGIHKDLLAQRGRYFDLYTKQHEVETNLFLAPGECGSKTLLVHDRTNNQSKIPGVADALDLARGNVR